MNPKPKPPMPGGEYTHISDTGPQYVPPGVPRVNLIPVGDGSPGQLPPPTTRRKPKPLLPNEKEIAKLPLSARAAFAARCALRVQPINHRTGTAIAADAVADAAVAILRVSTHPSELLFIRRDFDRLRKLVKANGWTDDTSVPPDVFGPMWPVGYLPDWATGKN